MKPVVVVSRCLGFEPCRYNGARLDEPFVSRLARFDEPYLEQQVFFEPYPSELVEITDSGKGRGKD